MLALTAAYRLARRRRMVSAPGPGRRAAAAPVERVAGDRPVRGRGGVYTGGGGGTGGTVKRGRRGDHRPDGPGASRGCRRVRRAHRAAPARAAGALLPDP